MTSQKFKFVKLWDLSGYSERTISKEPAWLEVAFRGQVVSRYKPSYALITPNLPGNLPRRRHQSVTGLISRDNLHGIP